ncbi:DUF3810 domain-containing protein [Ethanoligenens harbinense]|uniref:DUF3810 domain-containing protein n=1 Tax=Ethanoligenens harbinense (strain DSM 18485 / JCM 12961 / CGMCC 1.5033 / YUAN-3) TaxID=663278 RepID=E6U5X7_ETHHY|nr:DUF3810 domain-containing protein [Ethanoligenens harbinense]ADU27994.1 hypothetical protein Ethha_2501 [Ethanoligenens harbinense YUAN-3]
MKHRVRTIFALLLTPAALALQFWAARHSELVETAYSRGIYPIIASIFSTLFGLIPISVAEVLLALAAIVILCRFFFRLVRLPKTGPIGLWHGLLKFGAFLSVLFFLFTIWQLNYHREPLAQNLNYKTGTPNKAELVALTTQEVSAINALCPLLSWNKQGHSYEAGGFNAVRARVNDAYGRLSAAEDPSNMLLPRISAYPKAVWPSGLLAHFGIEGIYVPFTFEPTVDTGYPMFLWPFDAAHESAHLKGFAREDEANYWAYLADCASPDVFFQYSGHMNALLYLANALGSTDVSALSAQLEKLDTRAKSDINSYNAYVAKNQGTLSTAASKVNDSYLKVQGQPGVMSYDAFVDLLCDRYRTQTGV